MAYREKKIDLNYRKDAVTVTQRDVYLGGDVVFELDVWRELRNGNEEQTRYRFRLEPGEIACVIRTMKRALADSVEKLEDRLEQLKEEL